MSSAKEINTTSSHEEGYIRKTSRRKPSEVKKNNKLSQEALTSPENCLFCGDGAQKEETQQFDIMVNKALYSKYSSSQNYYYTKDVNEILGESRTAAVILFKDFLHADEEEEYLKRFYQFSEYDFKIKMLTEYYKFHNDIARIFISPVINIVNRYHDKKRRLEYIRVTKMLKEEQDPQKPETNPVEEKKTEKDYIITDRVLEGLDLTDPEIKQNVPVKNNQGFFGKSVLQGNRSPMKKLSVERSQLTSKGNVLHSVLNNKSAKAQKDGIANQSREISGSNTIHDLNMRLGEIISNSRSYNLDMNYLDNSQAQPNETMSNLSNFLLYLNKNTSTSNMAGIQKKETVSPASKILSAAAAPLTDRPYKPELAQTIMRAKPTLRGDLTPRLSDQLLKTMSPNATKTITKVLRQPEKVRPKAEDRSSNANSLIRQNSQTQTQADKPKKVPSVTKIKNFEEALKINSTQNSQAKFSSQSSIPQEHLQDKFNPNSSLKDYNRLQISRTPSKKPNHKSPESPLVRRQQPQPVSTNTSRPSSRTKTRSTDMYSKALDLLLGTNQILLGNQSQKREKVSYTHRSTKSSFNFKVKTPSQQLFGQSERSVGKDDQRVDSGLSSSQKIVSNKLASDRLYLQTEREVKKLGTTYGNFNLDIQRRDIRNGPLSERDYHKEKEPSRNQAKGMKAVIMIPSESETVRSTLNSQGEQRKIGLHKYTRSEGRMKKPEGAEKIEIINDVRSLMNGSGRSKGTLGTSPKRQTFIQMQNNIINVFVNSNHEKRSERTLTLKSERPGYQEGDIESIGRIFKSRSPNAEVTIRFNQSLPRKVGHINHDIDYKSSDFSPLRTKHKDSNVTQQMRSSNILKSNLFIC